MKGLFNFQLVDPNVHQNCLTAKGVSSLKTINLQLNLPYSYLHPVNSRSPGTPGHLAQKSFKKNIHHQELNPSLVTRNCQSYRSISTIMVNLANMNHHTLQLFTFLL